MDEPLQGYLVALGNEVRATDLSADATQTALWGLDQLPMLYAKFRLSNESRYGDEITRVVQGVLQGLLESKPASTAAQQLAARIPERLRHLHEEAGLPGLLLKAPRVAATTRSRKVG